MAQISAGIEFHPSLRGVAGVTHAATMAARNRSAFSSIRSVASRTRSTARGGVQEDRDRLTCSQSSSYQFGMWRRRPSTRERCVSTSAQVVMTTRMSAPSSWARRRVPCTSGSRATPSSTTEEPLLS